MRDGHHRGAFLALKLPEGGEDARLVVDVELSRRFVGEHERGCSGGCGGDCSALLLTTGQRARPVTPSVREPDQRQRGLGGGPRSPRAGELHRGRHVLLRRQELQKVVALEDKRHLPTAVACELGLVEPVERRAERADFAGGRLVEPGREVKERALARARGTEYGDELAFLDPEVETPERDRLGRA